MAKSIVSGWRYTGKTISKAKHQLNEESRRIDLLNHLLGLNRYDLFAIFDYMTENHECDNEDGNCLICPIVQMLTDFEVKWIPFCSCIHMFAHHASIDKRCLVEGCDCKNRNIASYQQMYFYDTSDMLEGYLHKIDAKNCVCGHDHDVHDWKDDQESYAVCLACECPHFRTEGSN